MSSQDALDNLEVKFTNSKWIIKAGVHFVTWHHSLHTKNVVDKCKE